MRITMPFKASVTKLLAFNFTVTVLIAEAAPSVEDGNAATDIVEDRVAVCEEDEKHQNFKTNKLSMHKPLT
jgi:hypothetical protein